MRHPTTGSRERPMQTVQSAARKSDVLASARMLEHPRLESARSTRSGQRWQRRRSTKATMPQAEPRASPDSEFAPPDRAVLKERRQASKQSTISARLARSL